jgi:hypothetical protein
MRSSPAGFGPAFTSLILGAAVALTVAACGTIAPSTGAPLGTASSHTPAPSATATVIPTPTPTARTAPATGTWQLLPPAPRTASLMAPVSVWTGHETLIYGLVTDTRTPYGNHGVLLGYTPATGQWRRLARAPAPRMSENDQFAVWTGTEMLVFGLTSAAYNPATNTWRRIAPANRPLVGAARVWTGHQVIVWGGGCCGGASSTGVAYTPAANTWRELPPSPLSARYTTGVWTGTEVIIAGGSRPMRIAAGGPGTFADAAAYNPTTRTWRTLPPMPQPRWQATAVWDGTEALFPGGTLTNGRGPTASGAAFNPATGKWRRLPRMEFGRSQFAAVWTGHQMLVWGGLTGRYTAQAVPPHGEAYDPVTNRWSALPQAPLRGRAGPLAVWTGSQMIVWGGAFEGKLTTTAAHDGAAYQPPAR